MILQANSYHPFHIFIASKGKIFQKARYVASSYVQPFRKLVFLRVKRDNLLCSTNTQRKTKQNKKKIREKKNSCEFFSKLISTYGPIYHSILKKISLNPLKLGNRSFLTRVLSGRCSKGSRRPFHPNALSPLSKS